MHETTSSARIHDAIRAAHDERAKFLKSLFRVFR